MTIVFFTAGTSGVGRFAVGCSLGTALRRAGIAHDYTMVSAHGFAHLADALELNHIEVPFEDPQDLSAGAIEDSQLYRSIAAIQPDVLVVGQAWYATHHLLPLLTARCVALFFQASAAYFRVPLPDGDLVFDPTAFDLVCGIEPWNWPIACQTIEPLVLRNPGEILPRHEAAARLGVDDAWPTALVSTNGLPGEFEQLRSDYSYLEDEYQVVYSSNYGGGIYPALDYFNLFDFIVSAGGYNAFWEAVYFGKQAHFVPQPRRFESQQWRIDNCLDYSFECNGADRLVEMILSLD